MSKLKKKDLISFFVNSLSKEQKELIESCVNRPVTIKTLTTLFTKAFKKTISIAARKSKSRECQKWVCAKISDLLDIPWGKDEEIASREMGQSGADVRLSPRVQEMFPYCSECKDDADWNVKKGIEQAKMNTKPGYGWLLFHKQSGRNSEDRVDPVVIMDAEHFFELLAKCQPQEAKKELKLIRRQKNGT